ncbi:MAG: hypothetical protein M1836_004792 [Candelina mexicana]|nr:MAG: hypothetical protein M1836_004792 [Candelina mexicana]
MVSVLKRMRKLKALLAIRLGPGAAHLPPDVKRIHMDFAYKINDGHFGPRKFWRLYLPSLKYHNPAISMTVNRTTDQEGPATMTIYFAPPPTSSTTTSPSSSTQPSKPTSAPTTSTTSTTAPSDHTPFTRTHTINMKHRHESEILSQLLEVTKAVKIKATREEEEEIREMEEERKRREADARRSAVVNAERKREEEMLRQARGQVAAKAELVEK